MTANRAPLGRGGAISRRNFAVDPVPEAAFRGATAVPGIRRRCEFLARFPTGPVEAIPAPVKLDGAVSGYAARFLSPSAAR